jgi:valine--pyruvate aminotransferase
MIGVRPRLSKFGERFTRETGALELMDDLGHAMSGDRKVAMLGGGNPGRIPQVQQRLQARLAEVAANQGEFDRLLANYAHPRGEVGFRRALAHLLTHEYGWPLTEDNIALTGGSQTSFFMLFNMLAGEFADGSRRRILLPVTPEYVGYADLGLSDDFFVARRPAIEDLDECYFKYRLDFDALDIDESIAAVCVSRPTNPTGNVLTDAEITKLEQLCRASGVPLILDSAYGVPFPGIVFTDAEPLWNDSVILCMSLSKFGLPGVRTGIVIANEGIIDALTRMTAVFNLSVGSVGPVLLEPMVSSGEIITMSRERVMPFYRERAFAAAELLQSVLSGLPFRIHKPEGAMFLWLWLPGLPVSSAELYRRLKARDVFVLSGHYFFPGLAEPWDHRDECLRLSFAQDPDVVERGIRLLGEEVRSLYAAHR